MVQVILRKVNGFMKDKGKQSVLFMNMLPHIYKKILVEGYSHSQCTDWLLAEHGLDIATPTFTSYLNRHGNIKLARERYNEYLSNYANDWWVEANNPPQNLDCIVQDKI